MAGPNLTGLTAITNILKCMRLNREYVKKKFSFKQFSRGKQMPWRNRNECSLHMRAILNGKPSCSATMNGIDSDIF